MDHLDEWQHHQMSSRSVRLDVFLELFADLKAVAGNEPNVLTRFDQTTNELRAAAIRLSTFLAESDIERDIFHGTYKMVARLPENFENSWTEFKQLWESPFNHFVMCEIDPDWPRDYDDHLKIYEGKDVVPDEKDDMFIPEFHDGRAAIRQVLTLIIMVKS